MAVKKKRATKARAPKRKAPPKAKVPAFLTTRQFNALVKKTRNQRRRRQDPLAAAAALADAPVIDLSQGFDPVGDE